MSFFLVLSWKFEWISTAPFSELFFYIILLYSYSKRFMIQWKLVLESEEPNKWIALQKKKTTQEKRNAMPLEAFESILPFGVYIFFRTEGTNFNLAHYFISSRAWLLLWYTFFLCTCFYIYPSARWMSIMKYQFGKIRLDAIVLIGSQSMLQTIAAFHYSQVSIAKWLTRTLIWLLPLNYCSFLFSSVMHRL